jgi:glycerol kinase
MSGYILSIDQGTTSTRSLIFDANRHVVASAQQEFAQHYPADGWVEHDAEDIWRDTLATAKGALAKAGLGAREIAAIGITNQRETVVLWDRATGTRCTAPSCGRIGGPRKSARNCTMRGMKRWCRSAPACCLTPIFRRRNWRGCWTMFPARVTGPKELAFGTIDIPLAFDRGA